MANVASVVGAHSGRWVSSGAGTGFIKVVKSFSGKTPATATYTVTLFVIATSPDKHAVKNDYAYIRATYDGTNWDLLEVAKPGALDEQKVIEVTIAAMGVDITYVAGGAGLTIGWGINVIATPKVSLAVS